MTFKLRGHILASGLVGAALATGYWSPSVYADQSGIEPFAKHALCRHRLHGDLFTRTELFFGLSRASGETVSEEQFQEFIDNEITPRFPDGLTLLSGTGQFRSGNGTIVKEGSKLLILLYRSGKHSDRAVEEVRDAYKGAFQQESVLRVDEASCVSF